MERKDNTAKKIYIIKFLAPVLVLAVGLASYALFVRPPTRENYIFTDGRIVFDPLRPKGPEIIMLVITVISFVLSAVIAVVLITGLIRRRDILYFISRGALCLLADILCIAAFICGGLVYCYSDYDSYFDDFSPEFYYFEHEGRRIVIAEGAFLLCGRSRIYQVYDDDTAWQIGTFDTDDGYANGGRYGMKWKDNGIEITYHDGTLANHEQTELFLWQDG